MKTIFEAGLKWKPLGRYGIRSKVDVVGDNRMADVLKEFNQSFDNQNRVVAIRMIGKSKAKSVPPGTFSYEIDTLPIERIKK